MENPAREVARMFADEFLTDSESKALAIMKITVMMSHRNTDAEALADALVKIGKAFEKNDEQIMKGVHRLYSEFLRRQ